MKSLRKTVAAWMVAFCTWATVTAGAAEGPATFPVSELTFSRPEAWDWVKATSSMRAAQLAVPDGDQDAGEVVFFYFGEGNGGGTDANVARWIGQFEESKEKLQPKVESKTVGGHKITYVEAHGTFLSGSPFGPKTPKAGYMLLGAIVEQPKGNVFVKFTGPSAVGQKAGPDFKKMVESALK